MFSVQLNISPAFFGDTKEWVSGAIPYSRNDLNMGGAKIAFAPKHQ